MHVWSLLFASFHFLFATDPSQCDVNMARLNAIDTSRTNGNASEPIPDEQWDSFTTQVAEDRNVVVLSNNYKNEIGQTVETTVVFSRGSDGKWYANREMVVNKKTVETKKWTQPFIPYTRKTMTDYLLEKGPIPERLLHPFARAVAQDLSISMASIDLAYRDLREAAFSKRPVVWDPQEALAQAVCLATLRLDSKVLARRLSEGGEAFGYAKAKILAHLEGREEVDGTAFDANTNAYAHIVGSIVSLREERPGQEADRALAEIRNLIK